MFSQPVGDHRQAATRLAIETGQKPCKGCGAILPLGEYPPDLKSPHIGASRCWDCRRTQRRAYYRRNPTPVREAAKAWAEANREARDANKRAWYEANRERVIRGQSVYKARRRARLARGECGCVTEPALRLLAELLGTSCSYCGGAFEHWDHGVPLSRGGLHCIDNLVPSCAACNLTKHAKTQEEFLAATGLHSEKEAMSWPISSQNLSRVSRGLL